MPYSNNLEYSLNGSNLNRECAAFSQTIPALGARRNTSKTERIFKSWRKWVRKSAWRESGASQNGLPTYTHNTGAAMEQPNEFDDVLNLAQSQEMVLVSSDIAKRLLEQLRHATGIADNATRSMIELNCLIVNEDGSEARAPVDMRACWYNVRLLEFHDCRAHVDQALLYLDKRPSMERHPKHRHFVRFL